MPEVVVYTAGRIREWKRILAEIDAAIGPDRTGLVHCARGLTAALAARLETRVVLFDPAGRKEQAGLASLAPWLWDKDVVLILNQGPTTSDLHMLHSLRPRLALQRPVCPAEVAEIIDRLLQRSQQRVAAWNRRQAG